MPHQDFSFTEDSLRQMAEQILDYAKSQGATACQAGVSEGFGQSVTVRKGAVETIEYSRDKGIGVTVYLDQRRGHASSADFTPLAIQATVDAALSIAGFTAPDDCAGLPEAALLAREMPDLDLYHPWDLSVADSVTLAQYCEAAAFSVSPIVQNSEGASVSTQQSQFVAVNSLGFIGGYRSAQHYLSCSVIVGEGGDMQRDDWYDVKRNAAELASPEKIGEYAARRALARLGARKLATCNTPVLFEAPLAASLIGNFVSAVSGGNLYRKTSFLLDSVGKQIFAPHIQIKEYPHLLKGLASSPFDDEGVAVRDRDIVCDGVLQAYFLSSYTARKLGLQTTGNAGGCHNLLIQSGKLDFKGMLKLMGRGLLVTELLGSGVNYMTGDYSRGAAGYWVENGEIAYPVHEITIAGNLKDMFRGIVAVGNDVLIRGSKQTGSILIDKMTVAGN